MRTTSGHGQWEHGVFDRHLGGVEEMGRQVTEHPQTAICCRALAARRYQTIPWAPTSR